MLPGLSGNNLDKRTARSIPQFSQKHTLRYDYNTHFQNKVKGFGAILFKYKKENIKFPAFTQMKIWKLGGAKKTGGWSCDQPSRSDTRFAKQYRKREFLLTW